MEGDQKLILIYFGISDRLKTLNKDLTRLAKTFKQVVWYSNSVPFWVVSGLTLGSGRSIKYRKGYFWRSEANFDLLWHI